MKSPFTILLAIVALIGISIGAAAIFFLAPTGQDDQETISFASESELPTPSARNTSALQQPDGDTTQAEVVVVSTSAITEESSPDELPSEVRERIENGEAQVVVTVETSGEVRGRGGFGGGGGDGPNVLTIQEAMESNPEIQALMEKAQSGNLSQADQVRLRELMQDALAEAGIEAPGGPQGGGFGTPPTTGTISAITGATITIDHDDDSGLSTDIDVSDSTNITVINELTPADLSVGTDVTGTVQRGEGGRIFIVNLAVIPEQQSQRGGLGGGFRGPVGAFAGGGDATNVSNINGTIAEVNEQTISVETDQGALRLTTNDKSMIISADTGTLTDIAEGMIALAFGGDPPNSLIVGSEILLQQTGRQRNRGQ